ncbi:MAG: hypothetical protein E3J65_03820 [Dehalococcoidia bacterium]|nr:MAG: hypothetical protein E3J65_03820 [Dehalococcoidia bacterium]
MVKKVVPLLLIVALFVTSLIAVGCGPAPTIVAIDLVPQEANLVASIQISRILTDADLIAAYDGWEKDPEMPQTFEQAMDLVADEIGIDLRDFSEAVIFGDTESEDYYFGAIITGTFDRVALIESIEGAIGEEMITTDYRGYTTYTITIEGEEGAICFLNDDSFVFGSIDAVRDVIDVKEGEPSLSGTLAEAYISLGDVWIKVAAEVPEGWMGEIPEEGVPIGLEALADVQVVGFGFNKAGQILSAQLKLYFSTSESAADAEGTISGLISFISILPDIPPEVMDLLDGLNVSRSGPWVTISLTTTMTEIEELVEAMEETGL